MLGPRLVIPAIIFLIIMFPVFQGWDDSDYLWAVIPIGGTFLIGLIVGIAGIIKPDWRVLDWLGSLDKDSKEKNKE
jgi:hypothetical protein